MKLYFEPAAKAWVHGIETVDHIAEIPEHLVEDVLKNSLWRRLTAEEEKALAAVESKRTRKVTQ